MNRYPQDTSLRHQPLAKLGSMAIKPQDMCCNQCGTKWVGNGSCPNGCNGLAKSEGEMTKKTLQGDNDLKKGLR